jgi:hypothetical protein
MNPNPMGLRLIELNGVLFAVVKFRVQKDRTSIPFKQTTTIEVIYQQLRSLKIFLVVSNTQGTKWWLNFLLKDCLL